ncbi:MAG: DUF488 domain-containing protein [Clostridia bacterium]|nr:DUF488 domain-containing protein [Clostridia bacterium]
MWYNLVNTANRDEMRMKLFTIGYSAYEREEFAGTLRMNGIDCVIDVRSVAASRYRPEYDRAAIGKFLSGQGVRYEHMPEEFGARQMKREYLSEEGYTDFEKYVLSDSFRAGYERVWQMTEAGKTCVLMCAEKDPVNCHRAVMAARYFSERGWTVIHITPDGNETHEQLEMRLLDLYFPNRYQLSMLDEEKSSDELLAEAYKEQNRKIGYRKEDGNASVYHRIHENNGGGLL